VVAQRDSRAAQPIVVFIGREIELFHEWLLSPST
jgi:hypothetical protein